MADAVRQVRCSTPVSRTRRSCASTSLILCTLAYPSGFIGRATLPNADPTRGAQGATKLASQLVVNGLKK
jgi:hypothetical protein